MLMQNKAHLLACGHFSYLFNRLFSFVVACFSCPSYSIFYFLSSIFCLLSFVSSNNGNIVVVVLLTLLSCRLPKEIGYGSRTECDELYFVVVIFGYDKKRVSCVYVKEFSPSLSLFLNFVVFFSPCICLFLALSSLLDFAVNE